MPNEAIERACGAYNCVINNQPEHERDQSLAMRAAISAYFADVPVSDAMVDAGGEVVFT